VCILLLAFFIPSLFPQWDVYATQFLRTHLLFIGALLLTLLFLLLWKYPQWEVAAVPEITDRIDLASKSRQTMAQIVGGAVLLVGLYFTAQTLRTTQEGQITDRFTKAIDQLGKDDLAVRLGGIYALERIARDSESDHWAVMEVLTTFVREQTQLRLDTSRTWFAILFPQDREASTPNADIQAILTVLGRRDTTDRMEQQYGLNLSKAQLQGAKLWAAKFQRANLTEAQLQGADFTAAQLQQAVLKNAQLREAVFWKTECQRADFTAAQLQGAYLWEANLQGAILIGAQLQGANLVKANLEGAQLQGVDLTHVQDLTQPQINRACVDENTRLPEGLTKPASCPTPNP
jgi:hypothetical protein